MNRLSSSAGSGIGCLARLLVDPERTWCLLEDRGTISNKGGVSVRELINPMVVDGTNSLTCKQSHQNTVYHTLLSPRIHKCRHRVKAINATGPTPRRDRLLQPTRTQSTGSLSVICGRSWLIAVKFKYDIRRQRVFNTIIITVGISFTWFYDNKIVLFMFLPRQHANVKTFATTSRRSRDGKLHYSMKELVFFSNSFNHNVLKTSNQRRDHLCPQ